MKNAIIVLLSIIVLLLLCFAFERPKRINEVVVQIDTIRTVDTLKVPYVVLKIDTVFTEAQLIDIIDSANCVELAKQYYAKNVYQDTLKNDSTAMVVLIDTVFKNMLHERIVEVTVFEKTNYVQPVPIKFELLAGIGIVQNNPYINIGYSKDRFNVNAGVGNGLYLINVNYRIWKR